MSLVLDSVIVLGSKAGSINQWTEILRLPFSSPFRYDGGGLMVLIGLDNETTQQVYFCVNNQDTGLSLAGYGSSSADAAERPEPAPLPTTTPPRRTGSRSSRSSPTRNPAKSCASTSIPPPGSGSTGEMATSWNILGRAPCRPTTTSMPPK